MSPKKLTALLPPKRAAKRDAGVNVRFTQDEYDELEHIANYREISVTELVYHVVSQFALPQLQEEMEAEITAASQATLSDNGEQQQTAGDVQSAGSNAQQSKTLSGSAEINANRQITSSSPAQKQVGSAG